MNKRIAIVGAGISGMSVAYLLKDKGYDITIFAKAFSPNITSNKAAAFWFPYHIRNDRRGINWCTTSYSFYTDLCRNEATGISMQKLVKVVRKGVAEEQPVWIDFMPEGSFRILQSHELANDIATAYEVQVPLIETQIFLPYLQNILTAANTRFIQETITDLQHLSKEYDVVINCSALGARELCNDEQIIPVRGQVGLLSPVDNMNIYLDNEKPLYIVPRKDAVIIGGTYEEGVELEETEPATIERLLQNAYNTFPILKEQKVLGNWAGLRPYRPTVRVERETNTNIIHNYGHGGSGFTLAFGCAKEVADIAESIIK